VDGALIKGLADAQPSDATVIVEARNARRYYGTSAYVDFQEGEHKLANRYATRIMFSASTKTVDREKDSRTGGWTIRVLQWFLKKVY
jgi:hypothetical protein